MTKEEYLNRYYEARHLGLRAVASDAWDAALSASAAPELLEAVETLLDCFVNDPLGWMDSSDIAIEKAYDAIHKAKGD
jgi:hypothetical protein